MVDRPIYSADRLSARLRSQQQITQDNLRSWIVLQPTIIPEFPYANQFFETNHPRTSGLTGIQYTELFTHTTNIYVGQDGGTAWIPPVDLMHWGPGVNFVLPEYATLLDPGSDASAALLQPNQMAYRLILRTTRVKDKLDHSCNTGRTSNCHPSSRGR